MVALYNLAAMGFYPMRGVSDAGGGGPVASPYGAGTGGMTISRGKVDQSDVRGATLEKSMVAVLPRAFPIDLLLAELRLSCP